MERAWLLLLVVTLTACAVPVDAPPPPTPLFSATPPPTQAMPTVAPATSAPGFCSDSRAMPLLSELKTAIQTQDGELLASLVSPTSGVGVLFIRNGNVVTYFDNIKFIFETTYEADWGLGPGSGEPVKGSFQEIVMPSLERVLISNPVITCNEIKVGGATYTPEWPYNNMNYYSLYYPGTDQYSGMDWETWAVGMTEEAGEFKLNALVHFAWEP